MSLFCWTQRKFVTRLFWGTIDSQSRKKIQWKFLTFFRISCFVFSRTNTFIQVWMVSKWWQNFHFWVNYPFKIWDLCTWVHIYAHGWFVLSFHIFCTENLRTVYMQRTHLKREHGEQRSRCGFPSCVRSPTVPCISTAEKVVPGRNWLLFHIYRPVCTKYVSISS